MLATVCVPSGTPISADNIGVVGIDLNADHVAMTDLDRFGNVVAAFRVPCVTRGKTHPQILAVLVDATSQVVTYAWRRQKPIVAERLGFEEKKAELERKGAGYARMLSGFAYATLHAILHARCYDAGIALRRVTPAYTSVIGAHKFADRYGLSGTAGSSSSITRPRIALGGPTT